MSHCAASQFFCNNPSTHTLLVSKCVRGKGILSKDPVNIKGDGRATEIAQQAKALTGKLVHLTSFPGTHIKKPDAVSSTYSKMEDRDRLSRAGRPAGLEHTAQK